jgi:hypothetical protein
MVKLGNTFLCSLLLVCLNFIGCSEPVSETRLTSLKISPATASIEVGEPITLKAIANYSDGTSKDIAATAIWTTSRSSVATIREGVLTPLSAGSVVISGKVGNVTAKANITVTTRLVSISVTPVSGAIAIGTDQQYTALGTYSDNSTQDLTSEVTWDSSDVGIATISNIDGAKGLASAISDGTTTVTATLGSISDHKTLIVTDAALVSIALTPLTPSIASGTQLQFIATGTFTDSTTQDVTSSVTWESSDEAIATINNVLGFEGLATSLSAGSTTITASYDEFISGSTTLTVTVANLVSIAVTPLTPSIPNGDTQQFTATGTYDDASTQDITSSVTWTSSDMVKATISNDPGSNGLATSLDVGTTTITATLGLISGNTDLTVDPAELESIVVTPANSSIRNGTLSQFTATGLFTDGTTMDITTTATWVSSDMAKATISNAVGFEGLATAVTPGATTITATFGLISGNTTLTVLNVNLVSIAVNPSNPEIAIDTSMHFIAMGTFDDASTQDLTDQVMWDSSDIGIATISNSVGIKGKATSVTDGSTTIAAMLGLISGNTTLTVTPATIVSVEVTPEDPDIVDGLEQQFVAMGTFSDASVQDITEDAIWDSSDEGVATIDSHGLATSVSDGTTTITATFDMVSDNTTLTVTPAELVSIEISPEDVSIGAGATQQFTAMGTYTDGSVVDITADVAWASSDEDIATISNDPGTEGLATGIADGDVVITATLGLVSDTTLTIEKFLDHVLISPTTPTLKKKTNRQLTGTAYYSDGSTANVTNSLTRWTTSDPTIIKVNQNSKAGKIRALKNSGSSTITFTYTENGITKSDTLVVTGIP